MLQHLCAHEEYVGMKRGGVFLCRREEEYSCAEPPLLLLLMPLVPVGSTGVVERGSVAGESREVERGPAHRLTGPQQLA